MSLYGKCSIVWVLPEIGQWYQGWSYMIKDLYANILFLLCIKLFSFAYISYINVISVQRHYIHKLTNREVIPNCQLPSKLFVQLHA